jgi:hypothetical protein
MEADARDEDVVYAVDASVAFLYAEPVANSFHAQMLGLLNDEILPDLAYVLGEISVRHAEETGGFILLPGHDSEFLRKFKEVQQRRLAELGRKSSVKLSEMYKDPTIRLDVKNIDARVQDENSDDVADFIAGKFEILQGMLRNKRFDICRWYDFVTRGRIKAFSDPEVDLPKPALSDKGLTDLEQQWFDAIKKEKSKVKSAIVMEDDAQALATLGWTNAKLKERGSTKKVVLLTLDESLQMAAFKQPQLPGASAIRDPRQFVRDLPSVIGPFVNSEDELDDRSYGVHEWLNILLTPFAINGQLSFENIRRTVVLPQQDPSWMDVDSLFDHHHGATTNTRLQAAQREWGRFIRLGVNRYAVQHIQTDPRLEKIANVISSGTIEGLDQALTEYVVEATSNISVSSIVAGLYISLGKTSADDNPDHRLFRMPVAIRSENTEMRDEFTKFMDQAVSDKNLDEVRPFLKFTEKYRAHLYYGAYFAAMGNWDATETLASAALAFAQARTKDDDISGTEAAYLLAVASRLRVKGSEDMARTERNLRRAVEKRRKSKPDSLDVRLVIEGVALNLMRHFGIMFLDSSWRSSTTHLMQIPEMLKQLHLATSLLAEETDDFFVQLVKKQLLGNFIVLATLEFLGSDGRVSTICQLPEFKVAVNELDEIQTKLSSGSPLAQAAQSRYLEILVGFGRWAIKAGDRSDEAASLKELLRSTTDKLKLKELPYDRLKYLKLAQLIR